MQIGPITLVAPLLSFDLLCACLTRAALLRHRPLRSEVVLIGRSPALRPRQFRGRRRRSRPEVSNAPGWEP